MAGTGAMTLELASVCNGAPEEKLLQPPSELHNVQIPLYVYGLLMLLTDNDVKVFTSLTLKLLWFSSRLNPCHCSGKEEIETLSLLRKYF